MQLLVPILGIKSLSLTFAMKVLLLLLLLLLNLIQTPLSQQFIIKTIVNDFSH